MLARVFGLNVIWSIEPEANNSYMQFNDKVLHHISSYRQNIIYSYLSKTYVILVANYETEIFDSYITLQINDLTPEIWMSLQEIRGGVEISM